MMQFDPQHDLPHWLLIRGPYETAIWQWLGLAGLVVIAWTAGVALRAVLVRVSMPFVKRSNTQIDNSFAATIAGPLELMLACVIFRAGANAIGASVAVGEWIKLALALFFYLALAWLGVRLVDVVSGRLVHALHDKQLRSAQAFLPLGRRTIKVAFVVFAILATLAAWGYNTTAILAGLGVGGLAVALAAQKTIENLFGGVAITADRPVVVGDFCKFAGKMGTVEDIGLRSTRIRTLDRTVITVPNASFSAMEIENFAVKEKIFFHPILPVSRDATPDQLERIMEGLREVLLSQPKVDHPGRVRLINLSIASFDIEVFAYVLTTDGDEFLQIQEQMLMEFLRVVERAGTTLATAPNPTGAPAS